METLKFDNQSFTKEEFENYVKNKIDSKMDLDFKDDNGNTLLMMASRYSTNVGSLEIVKKLIREGVDLNLQNNEGLSALMMSCGHIDRGSSYETMKTLIDSGADVNLEDDEGNTALIWVVKGMQ